MRHRITLTLGLALLMLLTAAAAVPAAQEPVGPIPDRVRLNAPAHDPYRIEISPNGQWIVYADGASGGMYSVDLTNGDRRWLGGTPPHEVQFTPDGLGVAILRDLSFGYLLRRRGLVSGVLEENDQPLSIISTHFSTTYDGLSLVYVGTDEVLEWWDEDGSVTQLPTADTPRGVGGAPDRDLVLYATYDFDAAETTIRGVTSTGVETTYGTIEGLADYTLDDAVFTFLPNQDRVIISLELRDGRFFGQGSWILDLVTEEIEHAATGFTPEVSPDGATAFFVEIETPQTGLIVPTEDPSQAVALPSAPAWVVHPEWTHIGELAGGGLNVYDIDGNLVRSEDPAGLIFTAVFVGDYFVTSQESSEIPVFADPIAGGPGKRVSRAVTSAWLIGGYDGFAYWREFKNGSWTFWRAQPNGQWRARITRYFDDFDFAQVVPEAGMLVFAADGDLWAIDLDALPKYACLNLLATHIGTNGDDVIRGTDGDDVIVGLAGNDTIRGDAGRDRICGNHDNDRLVGEDGDDWLRGGIGDDTLFGKDGDDNIVDRQGTNDANGGPGTDTCKVTGVMAGCELP